MIVIAFFPHSPCFWLIVEKILRTNMLKLNRELKEEWVTLPQWLVDQPPLSGKVDCASPSTVFLNVSLGISKRKVNQSVSNRMREAKIPDLSTVETCGSHLQTCSPMQFHPANVRDFFHQNTENHCERKSSQFLPWRCPTGTIWHLSRWSPDTRSWFEMIWAPGHGLCAWRNVLPSITYAIIRVLIADMSPEFRFKTSSHW